MAPPAAGPLIHGSTTPMAKETATAASTASPPPSSTDAPISAARRCAAATTPPRVGITALRTIWVREKLSMVFLVGARWDGRLGAPPLPAGERVGVRGVVSIGR